MEAFFILAVVQSGDELIPLQAGGVGSQLIEDQREVVFAECGKILLHLCVGASLQSRNNLPYLPEELVVQKFVEKNLGYDLVFAGSIA